MDGMDRSNAGLIQKWRVAGPALDEIRRDELRHMTDADVAAAIRALSQAFWIALRNDPPSQTSGLVEQQKLFMRGHQSWKT
jgi:hypothetical protein